MIGWAKVKSRMTWRRLAGPAVLLGVGQFVVLTGVAMAIYPGGTVFDATTVGYSFWSNSLSDLERTVSLSGQPNPVGSVLYRTAMVAMTAAFVPLWLVLPTLFPARRRIGGAVTVLGLISVAGMIGIPLTPSDIRVAGHMIAIGVAAVPGLTAAVLSLIGMAVDASCPRRYPWMTAAMLIPGGAHFAQYALHFWFGWRWTPAAPLMQKIAVAFALAWLTAVALGTLSRKRFGGESKSARGSQCGVR